MAEPLIRRPDESVLAGMERFFDRFATGLPSGREEFAEVAAGAGMDVLGPPLAESHPV